MSTLLSACATVATQAAPVVRLVALGGPMNESSRAQRGVDALQALGFTVDNQVTLTRRASRFAGSVAARADDLNALADPRLPMPDLLLATRGGFGAIQLLEHLDFARLGPRLRASGTLLMGYSDNTTVQLALLAQGGVITLSGPMLYSDFAATQPSAFTMGWLRQVLSSDRFSLRVDAPQFAAPTQCAGTLWGGNLTVLTSLLGTPWMPQVPGGILFLEDVGEDVYKVDRLLTQLRLAGVLHQQSAILLGHFSSQRADGFDPGGYTMAQLARQLSAQLQIPVLSGLPIGHVADIVPLPIGAQGQLQSNAQGFTLTVSGYPACKRLPAAWAAAAASSS